MASSREHQKSSDTDIGLEERRPCCRSVRMKRESAFASLGSLSTTSTLVSAPGFLWLVSVSLVGREEPEASNSLASSLRRLLGLARSYSGRPVFLPGQPVVYYFLSSGFW